MPVMLRERRRKPQPFEQPNGERWLFRSFDDLCLDLQDWSDRLPPISAVCGVPRSGVIVASVLSTLLNVPLLGLEALQADCQPARPSRSKPLPPRAGKILVVDDSLWSGGTMSEVIQSFGTDVRSRLLFGAVYANAKHTDKLDVFGFGLNSINHSFAWNYLRDMHARSTLTDMDGVLCADWPGEVNDEDAVRYADFLENAAPRIQPIFPVLGIVTGRVAIHRAATEAWLARHSVRHHGLHMPFPELASRAGACVGTEKAKIYAVTTEATLFVESDARQAMVIATKARKPVLCTDTLELLQ